jgi:hypothetical protein
MPVKTLDVSSEYGQKYLEVRSRLIKNGPDEHRSHHCGITLELALFGRLSGLLETDRREIRQAVSFRYRRSAFNALTRSYRSENNVRLHRKAASTSSEEGD